MIDGSHINFVPAASAMRKPDAALQAYPVRECSG
jgi:hypothetical protein